MSIKKVVKSKLKRIKKRLKKGLIKIKSISSKLLFKTINMILCICPINKKKVLFLSDQRDVLGGNLECIYNKVKEEEYKKILILKKGSFTKRKKTDWLKLIYNLTTSKYIILDDWNSSVSLMHRRKKQEIVQLWHGPGAFKTFGFSRIDRSKKISKYSMHRNYTKAIVTSEMIRWCYAEGFGMPIENIKATGYPRTDCLFDNKYKEKIRNSFYKEHPDFKGKKIILFAPTYRGNSLRNAYYDFDKLDLDKIYKELDDNYVFIIKWHPGLYNKINASNSELDISKYKGKIYDFSMERDVNDLLIVTDILITDYSSVIFDYLLLNKPIIYYAYDLELYKQERGLYYDFEDYIYGLVAYNMDELIKAIKKPDMMNSKRNEFNEKFMKACDGKSTERVYDYIFKSNK